MHIAHNIIIHTVVGMCGGGTAIMVYRSFRFRYNNNNNNTE